MRIDVAEVWIWRYYGLYKYRATQPVMATNSSLLPTLKGGNAKLIF